MHRIPTYILSFMEQVPYPVWFAIDGKRLYFNYHWHLLTKTSFDDSTEDGWLSLLHHDDCARYLTVYEEALQLNRPMQVVYRLTSGDGEWQWIDEKAQPFYNEYDELIGYVGYCFPIGDDNQATAHLQTVITKMADALSLHSGQSFFNMLVHYLATVLQVKYAFIGELVDEQKQQINVISMYRDGEVVNDFQFDIAQTPSEFVMKQARFFPADAQTFFPNDTSLTELAVEGYMGTPLLNADGKPIGVLSILNDEPLQNEGLASALLRIFAVRTANELVQRQLEEELKNLAHYDSLTQLYKRSHFLTLARSYLLNYQDNRFALLHLDLDNFRMINDTLGHQHGDELLKQFAARIRDFFLEDDVLLARVSGDEFYILIRHTLNERHWVTKLEDFVHHCQLPFEIAGYTYFNTVSIGISLFPTDGTTIDLLIRNATAALQRAKKQGKNGYSFYTEKLHNELQHKLMLKQDLHQALTNNEFQLYFQPQVDSHTGKIVSFEVLLRWHHPRLGLLTPYHFIELAEENGLIVPIGDWVIAESCRVLKRWHTHFQDETIKIAVNLSPQQFIRPTLVNTVLSALHRAKLTADALILEITESVAMQNLDYAIETLNYLREAGIQVHLDDFGTGYSSLNYLSKLPIDALKIDRSFVQNIDVNVQDTAIVNAIIAMAKSLHLAIIAEGVETIEQLNYLTEKHCDHFQGFYFSKPVPSDQAEQLLNEQPFIAQ